MSKETESKYVFKNPFYKDPIKEAEKERKKQEKESKKQGLNPPPQIPSMIEINEQIGNQIITGSCNVGIKKGKIIPTNCILEIKPIEPIEIKPEINAQNVIKVEVKPNEIKPEMKKELLKEPLVCKIEKKKESKNLEDIDEPDDDEVEPDELIQDS